MVIFFERSDPIGRLFERSDPISRLLERSVLIGGKPLWMECDVSARAATGVWYVLSHPWQAGVFGLSLIHI